MKLHLFDDLHLEFSDFTLPGGEILLLAGDITVADCLRPERTDDIATKVRERTKRFFTEETAKYTKAFYVAGNHEHYHGIWQDTFPLLRELVKDTNVTVLDKESAVLNEDTVIWGGTLWTSFEEEEGKRDPFLMMHAGRGMNDFHCIGTRKTHAMYGSTSGNFRPETSADEHKDALTLLTAFLEENPNKKVIVMTHHCPSFKSSHPRHGVGNPLNWAYCSHLDQFILTHPQIKAWVHGHTHDSHDYLIGGTRVMCNPRGYAYHKDEAKENPKFNINQEFVV